MFLIPTPLTPAVVYLVLIPAFLIAWMLFYSLKIIAYACALNKMKTYSAIITIADILNALI